jgi:hypothetical protein
MLYRATIFLNRDHMRRMDAIARARGLKAAQLVRLLIAGCVRGAAKAKKAVK